MKKSLPLQEESKLSVTYRVEAGCLGPDGIEHIFEFCKYAQTALQTQNSDYISWNIVYRKDKTLPEIQYRVIGKIINSVQTEKYLAVFNNSLDEFESNLSDQLTMLINHFMISKKSFSLT